MTDRVELLRKEIECRIKIYKESGINFHLRISELENILAFIERLQENTVKLCIFSKEGYTDENREAFCDGCEEDCKYNKKEEPASDGIEKELESWRHNHFHGRRDKEASGEYLERVSQLDLAKHFFELGLKAQKGE